jgi:hypothetical protein
MSSSPMVVDVRPSDRSSSRRQRPVRLRARSRTSRRGRLTRSPRRPTSSRSASGRRWSRTSSWKPSPATSRPC